MLRIFHQYRPRQVARYVKGFFRGRVYIDGVGAFEFDRGRLLPPHKKDKRALAVMTEVNNEIKAMAVAA
ncbi:MULTISPECIES: DUF1107 domain-containing protein [Grimontia]|uniref:DUF1107 domain-containing protein n=1 Tax=Grimontia marina TaxID=646534 RepID=A0A128F9V8_9GAMM|nr:MULTISPECIES: DUF1107 domain-containing protein [Grimontia]WRV96334.1 DUF1107 domain-containing protein [Grimontia sp. NTOU-MAR1]CZF83528.1 hypothetical protein GMA8713_02702 [Grimontia marina]